MRTITLPDALVDQLTQLDSDGSVLVFPNRSGSYLRYSNWLRDSWKPAVERSGVKALPHNLRATCASLRIDAGASVKDVQAHLGHRDEITTLRLYARVRPQRNLDIAAKLDALIARPRGDCQNCQLCACMRAKNAPTMCDQPKDPALMMRNQRRGSSGAVVTVVTLC